MKSINLLLLTIATAFHLVQPAGAYLPTTPPAAFVNPTSRTSRVATSSSQLSMTIALPSPVSVSVGPLKHQWYDDFGHGSDRRVKYWDDDNTVEFAYTSFAYDDWQNRIRDPEEAQAEAEWLKQQQNQGLVRRTLSRLVRPFRRT